MHRLEHGRIRARGIDVSGGSKANTASYRDRQIGQNVSKKVIGDNNVIARRLCHHINSRSINMLVIHPNLWKLGGDFINGALPQPTSIDQDICLVHQGQMLTALRCPRKRIAYYTLHAETSILRYLAGHLVLSSLSQGTAVSTVQTLGTFAHHNEIDIARFSERRGSGGIEPGGAQVHVMIQRKPHLKQQSPLQHTWWHLTWSADRSQ